MSTTHTYALQRLEDNGRETHCGAYQIEEGQDLNAAILELARTGHLPAVPGVAVDPSKFKLEKLDLQGGRYYPRLARPLLSSWILMAERPPGPLYIREENGRGSTPRDAIPIASAMNQLSILKDDLQRILKVIEPSVSTMQSYGHEISNLLILASMNFENECKGIFTANAYPLSARSNTTDYVKILPALELDQYSVTLPFYPSVQAFAPFLGWDAAAPTQSLAWYDSYNAVKHNRQTALQQATLGAAISAVAACAVMMAAQYRQIESWTDQLDGFFHFNEKAEWATNEYFLAPEPPDIWTLVNWPF